jgi:hypothetical protein
VLDELGTDVRLVDVRVNRPPWTAAGIDVAAGEQVTWLAWGAVYAAKPLGIGFGPSIALIGRVGDGPVHDSARDTLTFTADRDGPVELASRFPGEPREDGSFATDRLPYRAILGDLQAVVVRWAAGTDPRDALLAVAAGDASGLCAAEAARLSDPPQPPPGWDHHPLIGEKEIYAPSQRGITAHSQRTVGIVRKPAEAPLTPTLRLRWSWRLDELPSRLPEDTALTHDYLSVALAFDVAPSRNAHRRAQRHRATRPLDRRRAARSHRPSSGDRRSGAGASRAGVADRGQLLSDGRGARRIRTHRAGRWRRATSAARRFGRSTRRRCVLAWVTPGPVRGRMFGRRRRERILAVGAEPLALLVLAEVLYRSACGQRLGQW